MITKCANTSCPIRSNCWRFAAPTAPNQSFAMFTWRREAKTCDDYIHVTDREKRMGGPLGTIHAG